MNTIGGNVNQFKFCSNPTKFVIALFLLSGCSHTTYSEKELAFWNLTPVGYGITGASGSTVDAAKFYCQRGKQRRALKTQIRAIIPKQPVGTPLDKAATMDKKALQIIRESVKNFYRMNIGKGGVGMIGSSILTLQTYPGFRSNKYNDFLNYFKANRHESDKPNLSETPLTGRIGETVPLPPGTPVFLYFKGNPIPVLLGLRALPTYETRKVRARSYIQRQGGRTGNIFGAPTDIRFETVVKQKNRVTRTKTPDEPVYPVTIIKSEELSELVENYTMLIPYNVQKSIWKEAITPKRNFFLKEDGGFDLSEAVNHNDFLWQMYINAMTSVKEAQTSDPQIIDYHVSLDLGTFCQYKQLLEDLVVK